MSSNEMEDVAEGTIATPASRIPAVPEYVAKPTEEQETCRICRGEGTKNETLFYPCKCSGSIKFVHQDCLMEWLSHSQKKHCELCKTPFRFTKLYHPQMPSTIPTTVFLRRATLHTVTKILVWCRAVLVISIWVFLLPLSIRWAWRSLFWTADGDWTRKSISTSVVQEIASTSSVEPDLTGRSAASVTSVSPSFSWMAFGLSISVATLDVTSATIPESYSSAYNLPSASIEHNDGSLLSGFSFFRNLTPLPIFNKFVTDVLEGQIITLCVVVAFILVFLIREWVIQQQPVNHMAALNEDQQEAQPVEPPQARDGQTASGTAQDEQVSPTIENVEALILHLQTTLSNNDDADERGVQVMGESSDSQRLDDLRVAARMVVIHSMLSAIEGRTKEAIERRDLEALSALQSTLKRFKDSIQFLPERYHADLQAAMGATEVVIHTALTHLNQINSEVLEETEQHTGSLSASVGEGSASSSTQAMTVGAQARPTMPTRSDSSLATEIQRRLAENTAISHPEISSNPKQIAMSHDAQLSGRRPDRSRSQQQISDEWDNAGSVFATDDWPIRETGPSSDSYLQSTSSPKLKTSEFETFVGSETTAGPSSIEEEHKSSLSNVETHRGEASAVETTSTSSQCSAVDDRQPFVLWPDQDTPQARPEAAPNADLQTTLENNEVPIHEIPIPPSLLDWILDWIWGDEIPVEATEQDEHPDVEIVRNGVEEAPLHPLFNARPEDQLGRNDENIVQEPDIGAVADQIDNNQDEPGPDADAEDLEGIMELIGMQGPIVGLFQNVIFSAVIIFLTLSSCVWLPYIWGKVVLLFAANPISLAIKIPVHTISITANLAVDFVLFFTAMLIHWIEVLLLFALKPMSSLIRSLPQMALPSQVGKTSGKLADAALLRIVHVFAAAGSQADPEYFHMSLNSHLALRSLQSELYSCLAFFGKLFWEEYDTFRNAESTVTIESALRITYSKVILPLLDQLFALSSQTLTAFTSIFKLQTGAQVGLAKEGTESTIYDYGHVVWNTTDRIIVILVGYGFFALLGTIYLNRGSPMTTSLRGRRIEAALTEFLQQAGGVLKVILIISIEMIVFPLYCGFLLDTAMLPLFEEATFLSRLTFCLESPWTSVFVHWFVGTCYMFHFALFVSMCRKIMRTGVLYFIRDPDDPTFHPIRDVLEKSVTSQLRKIAFSGLVYGALVIVCLGGVVWMLNFACFNFLPVHWTTGEPILGFPIDLLMYNFLMPLVLRSTEPSKGLHKMYDWWFRRCARQLCLSGFLFNEHEDDQDNVSSDEGGRTVKNGKYFRVPASDQVRIPKDQDVFLEVDQQNNRIDGKHDQENGMHGSKDPHFIKVFIPGYFMIRVALFVFCLWALTAVIGLLLTVLPLLLGRKLSALFIDGNEPVNDIHAFAIGIYIFGGTVHLTSKYLGAFTSLASSFHPTISLPAVTEVESRIKLALKALQRYVGHFFRVIYTYSALAILFPSLFAFLAQFYIIMPLHTYLRTISYGISVSQTSVPPESVTVSVSGAAATPHSIHFLQDWALGLLYLHIVVRLITRHETSRPARALRAIVQEGWLRPNTRLATRCFILPTVAFTVTALLIPAPLGWLVGRVMTSSLTGQDRADLRLAIRVLAYRYAYPAVLSLGLIIWICLGLIKATARWRLRIRDEVYLIGERLHNFGEKKPPKISTDDEIKLRLRRQTF